MPDKGFQQAGIIVRNGSAGKENNILLCLGTAGSSTPKFFLRTTSDGKSKTIIDKIDSMNTWLRLEKKGTTITAYSKFSDADDWVKIKNYTLKWLNDSLQVGIMTMAQFAGDGPQMKPDMKAIFTHFNLMAQQQ